MGQHSTERNSLAQRVLRVLEALVTLGPDAELGVIAEHIGSPRATVHRVLAGLVREQYAYQVRRGVYRVGPRLMTLSGNALSSLDYLREAAPSLERLRATVPDTIHFGVLVGNWAIYAAKLEGPRPYHMRSAIGMRVRLETTAIGKVILANRPPEDVPRLVDLDNLEPLTAHTIVNRLAFARELKKIQAQGYAIDDEENEDGVRCVAAPVFDHNGMAVAGVSVSAPAFHLTRPAARKIAPHVIATAAEISAALGYGRVGSPSQALDLEVVPT